MTTMSRTDTDRARLQGAALADALACCPAWHYDTQRGGTISRTFEFSGFRVAFAFMTQLAFIADKVFALFAPAHR